MFAGTLVLGLGLLAAVSPAMAADAADGSQSGKLDTKTRGTNVRASQLIGLNVWNGNGKELGEVNDLVIDTASGRIRYAAVSYGGFLGLGDKLFAVPWQAFHFRASEDSKEPRLVLNVSEEKIKNAPGFDQDHWPDFGDREFTSGIDRHYGVHLGGRRGVNVDVNVERKNRGQ